MSSISANAIKSVPCGRFVSYVFRVTGLSEPKVVRRLWAIRCWASGLMLYDKEGTKILVVWSSRDQAFCLIRADHRGTAMKKGGRLVAHDSLDEKLLEFYKCCFG